MWLRAGLRAPVRGHRPKRLNGVTGTVSNSQCAVDGGASSFSGSGSNLTVTMALTFKPAFSGAKNIYMDVVNNGSVASGWQAKGAWTTP